jgi:type IV secretion system protein VirD4
MVRLTFAALKERTATVFLVLPPDRISTYHRWLRLMVAHDRHGAHCPPVAVAGVVPAR